MRKEIDMLNGSMLDKILKFALPLAATGMLQQLFNAADVAIVGKYVGKTAMAAVGGNAPITSLILNLFTGISIGANVVIAKFIGQNRMKSVRKSVHTALLFAFVSGSVMAVVCEIISRPLLSLMSIPENVFEMALLYFRVYVAGLPVILLYDFSSAIFRSRGNTATPLICLLTSGVINVFLNLFFVIVLKMTVNGVALATVIANLISSALLLFFLSRDKNENIRFNPKELRIEKSVLASMVKIGLPAGLQGMVFSFSNIIIQSSINKLGENVMAASSAAFNIEILAYYVINAFGQTCTTFVGQNYGAGNAQRCLKASRLTLLLSMGFTLFISFAMVFFGRPLLHIFADDSEVIETGMIRLKFILLAEGINVVIETVSGCMRGYGRSLVPALMCMFGICGVRISWIYFYFNYHQSFTCLMTAYPLSWIITSFGLVIAYIVMKKKSMKDFFAKT